MPPSEMRVELALQGMYVEYRKVRKFKNKILMKLSNIPALQYHKYK